MSTDIQQDSSKMEAFLRKWRQTAFNAGQFQSAIFVGDKLLALTNDDNDAFWMAQVHFSTGNYTRAQKFLENRDLVRRNPSCRYLAAHCLIKQSRFDEALTILGERDPTYLIRSKEANKRKTQPGASSKTLANSRSYHDAHKQSEAEAGDRRYEAGMCYLRGICYAKQNSFDRAKECYKNAVRIDVQCFEAFNQLTQNSLLSSSEEWEFLESLDFASLDAGDGTDTSQEEIGDYVQYLYCTRLSKYRKQDTFNTACETLTTHYNLGNNPDILLAKADQLFTQSRFKDALEITNAILTEDKYNFSVYPTHLACLFELNEKNLLFLVAHELADSHPEEPCTWLAVATYYYRIGKIAEARRYFSKASMMDAHFYPAWIGFAHTFAAEGEHDQAISAYSTAARLFMGTHLPQVFLGMQHHAMNNMTVAEEFFNTAYELCSTDPLLLNEMGIVYYHQNRLKEAIAKFKESLAISEAIDSDPQAWIVARTNLGHSYRRQRKFSQALAEFDTVLRETGKDAAIFCSKGLIFLDIGKPEEAVNVLHEALAIHPQDPVATELLLKALDESSSSGRVMADIDDEGMAEFEQELGQLKQDASSRSLAKMNCGTRRGRAQDKGKEKAVAGASVGHRRANMMDLSDDH
ncbi:unnamed protein product [Discula destructiva]